MVQTINNETLLKEAYPLARRVRPSIGGAVHVDIIGELTPELPVQAIKFWSPGVMESMAKYYAVSARDAGEALRKYVEHCDAKALTGRFASRKDYELWARVNPKIAGEYEEHGGGYFAKAYFKVQEYTLQDFVIEYCKVM